MLFNSIIFFFFFILCYLIYWNLSNHHKAWFLVIASAVFYSYWSLVFFIHFLSLTLLSYIVFLHLLKKPSSKIFKPAISIILANLFFFKYITASIELLFGQTGVSILKQAMPGNTIVLPLAISFYSFQIISILSDAKRQTIKYDPGITHYVLFITFFPQLIAGPIMRHSDFFSQIKNIAFKLREGRYGLAFIAFGLFKKVVIADNLAELINPIYNNPAQFDSQSIALAIIGFPLQIYADFSGYTDIARGLAKMLGYNIPENFLAPYFASSFRELWRRWHVTLSTWLRDYLYIPLGGSRCSKPRMFFNILVTMTLGGLWHGNDYTFFAWGLVCGSFLIFEMVIKLPAQQPTLLRNIGMGIIIFALWSFAAIFFRASSLQNVNDILQGVVSNTGQHSSNPHVALRLIVFSLFVHAIQYYRVHVKNIFDKAPTFFTATLVLMTYYFLVRTEASSIKFMYFQF